MMPMTISKKEIIAKLHQLPSLPLIVQAVIASFNDPNLDTASLAIKITQDQGVSAKVLRLANSTFYGLPRKVGSIQDAVVVLGFDTIRSLALSAGMVHAFPPSPGSLFDRQAYWQRSFRVAALAMALAKNSRQEQQLAFTAGMFYDIGQLVLDLCIPQRFAEVLQRQATSGLSLIELERSELGFDQADIGAEVIRLWNFPPEIERVVRDWRQPEREPFAPLVGIVHVAVLLESGLSVEDLMTHLPKTLCGRLQMTQKSIEASLPHPDQLEASASLAQTN
jgi:HD-like signal output (HDOD) protein